MNPGISKRPAVVWAFGILAATIASAPFAGETGDGLMVYHIGNSHTHSVRNVLMPLAHAAGHTEHTYSWSSILGAPLRWIRDHDEESGGWEAEPWSKGLAPDRSWDVLTLQAYASDQKEIDAAVFFSGLAYEGNPKCQVYMYTIWPSATDDWDNPPAGRQEAFTEKCAGAIAKKFPDSPRPRVIPSSLIMRELGRLADDGELPNVPNRFQLLADGGHLSDLGNYAVNVTFCSMIYREPPFRYPNRIPEFRERSLEKKTIDLDKTQFEIPVETADVIKRVVWDVLAAYPPAAMDVGLVIADRSLPPGVTGRPYRHKFKALNTTGKPGWLMDEGILPGGIKLSPDGILSGTPGMWGDFPFTVQVTDRGRKYRRDFTLQIRDDVPPRIGSVVLPEIPLDRYILRELAAAGGVGKRTWSVVDGKLPHGVTLRKPGILVGTPGESGKFTFRVRVTDSHPGKPRSDDKEVEWSIGKASPRALAVRKTAEPITVDGQLAEPFWSLDNRIAKAVRGEPTKTAAFGVAWSDKSNISKKGCLYAAVKVTDGPEGKTPGDAIHVFLDALHNRQIVYNADDMHFVVNREGRKRSIRGKPDWFLKVDAAEIDGGYVVEMAIPVNYFIGNGAWVPFGEKAIYGFDVAVDEGDGEIGRQVWRGGPGNEDDTSGFGSLVLTARP